MAILMVFKKLTPKEAEQAVKEIEAWFRKHPRRRVCRTDLFRVRRGHVAEDVYARTQTAWSR